MEMVFPEDMSFHRCKEGLIFYSRNPVEMDLWWGYGCALCPYLISVTYPAFNYSSFSQKPPAKSPFLDRWIKWQLTGREHDGFPVYQENFLRQVLDTGQRRKQIQRVRVNQRVCKGLSNKRNTKIFCRQSKSFLFRSPSCSRCLWQTSACARCSNHCDFARLWLRLRLWPMVFLSRTTGWGRLRLSISMGHLMGRRDSRQVWIIAIPAKCEIPFTQ